MTSEAQKRATKRYIAKMDEIKIRLPAGSKEKIKRAANAEGLSMNRYIISLLARGLG
jgi:predicted DNA binding CopG/RHH family protein